MSDDKTEPGSALVASAPSATEPDNQPEPAPAAPEPGEISPDEPMLLQVGATDDGQVRLSFGRSITQLTLPADVALQVASTVYGFAQQLISKQVRIERPTLIIPRDRGRNN